MSAPQHLPGIAALADRFDDFLIDQFGVLRDGKQAYPQAPATLERLKAAGKRIVILSNSGKRSAENDRRLAGIGFQPGSWDWFLTSGEVAWRQMAERRSSHSAGRCLLISRDGDLSPLQDLPFTPTQNADEADLVLIAASEGDRFSIDHYHDLLAPAALRDVPCLCTNPDKIMLTADGPAFGAGRIAELYESLGGKVEWIGKPFPAIYQAALDFLKPADLTRVCCLGDSVEHDIAGAAGAGLKSVLVTTGILANASPEQRAELFEAHGAIPDFIIPSFIWQEG
ncbi:TIGR01459 family HAD-type hydrolase [Rhizobium paknamense]|uniref:HAD superfamily hydrolase (TIGR01459 family) n=1 Tax=Rhizobium paknamense TaxID=1206817 RepID=A0ABU0II62_9HYPH|nr:TIGR01459 family HAD-type hydrolase [Rhizobium paknamense]MDQ0457917.1 HAD superfamily hydrolase (TIGR01459 family) [Rhizobium paknamense]